MIIRIQPPIKGTEIPSITVLRPNKSIRAPPLSPPTRAPKLIKEATQENSKVDKGSMVRLPKSLLLALGDEKFFSCESAGDDQPSVVPMIHAPIAAADANQMELNQSFQTIIVENIIPAIVATTWFRVFTLE